MAFRLLSLSFKTDKEGPIMTTKKKILLIDDDSDFLLATKLILETGGYEVFMAEDRKSVV